MLRKTIVAVTLIAAIVGLAAVAWAGAARPGWGMGPGSMMRNDGTDQGSWHQGPGYGGMMGNGGADQGSWNQGSWDDMARWMSGQMGMSGHRMMVVDSEFGYLAQMIPHHEEAIASAEVLQQGTDRPEMEAFAQEIIDTQSTEVAQMRTWLATWYPGQETSADYDPMMRDLTGLTGDELDRAFLEDMIGHHMTAVMMSQQLLAGDLAEHQELVPFAEQIRDDQHAEIFQMSGWLADWFDESAMGPTRLCH